MLRLINNFFSREPKTLLGIDIGANEIKIAEVVNNKQPVLKNIASFDYSFDVTVEYDADALADLGGQLRRFLNINGFLAKHAVFAVGGRHVFVREVEVPFMTESELKEAVKWDIERYVPYETDAYYYDFSVVGPGKTDMQMKLLLVAAPKVIVDRIVALAKSAGVRTIAIEIESAALARTMVPGSKQILVADIGHDYTQLTVFRKDVPTVIRSVPIGGKHFTKTVANALNLDLDEAERLKTRQQGLLQRDNTSEVSDLHNQLHMIVAEIATEIRRTAEFYQLQNQDAAVESILLTGGGSGLDNLIPNLIGQLGPNIRLHDPLAGLTGIDRFDELYLAQNAARFAVAVGLALRGGEQ